VYPDGYVESRPDFGANARKRRFGDQGCSATLPRMHIQLHAFSNGPISFVGVGDDVSGTASLMDQFAWRTNFIISEKELNKTSLPQESLFPQRLQLTNGWRTHKLVSKCVLQTRK
jgi:hypothetical protein